MRSHVSRTVGCIIRDINIPGLATFVRAAHDIFMEAGYALLLSSPVQALTAAYADLDFRHVPPTRVPGRVVELHTHDKGCSNRTWGDPL
jgi:hypothetical protein